MKKHIILLLIITLSSLQTAWSQYNLSGVVKDTNTNEPLGGVNIYSPTINKGTITNIQGQFAFKDIPEQKITLQFSYEGYKPLTKEIIFDMPNKHIEVKMTEDVFEIDEVIVSTGLGKLQKDNVMKVSHKKVASMNQKGIQNIMEGIAQIPGVSNLSTGTGIAKPVIRGLSGNRVLVYNQGVRLENYQFGEEHGMGIESAGVSDVEVIKGPASLLYGSDALGGVVYLVPEKFAPDNDHAVLWENNFNGNTKGVHNSIAAKLSTDQWQFLARGTYKLNGNYKVPSGERVENSANNAKDLKLGIGFHNDKLTTDLRYNYNHTQNGIPLFVSSQTDDIYKFIGPYQDLTTNNISLKNDLDLSNSNIKTNIGFSQVRRRLIKNDHPFIDMQLRTVNADVKWYLPKLQDWEIILGTQGMAQQNHNFGAHFLLPNAQISQIGIFSNVNRKFNKTLMQGGIRYDYQQFHTETINASRSGFDKHLSSFTGAFGVKQNISNKMNLRLNIASGFRAPNLAELTSNGEHEGRIEIGNPDLKNEHNLQTDLNLDYSHTHFEFFVNAFYNNIDNYIYLEPQNQTQNGLPVYAYKQNNAYLYGGEAGVHFHPHPWDWLHINNSYETVIGKKEDGDYLPLISADQWKNELKLTKKVPHNTVKKYFWSFEVNHTFKARTPADEDDFPAYTLLNTSIGINLQYKRFKANAFMALHNITNETYISNLSVLREKGIPNQERTLMLGINMQF